MVTQLRSNHVCAAGQHATTGHVARSTVGIILDKCTVAFVVPGAFAVCLYTCMRRLMSFSPSSSDGTGVLSAGSISFHEDREQVMGRRALYEMRDFRPVRFDFVTAVALHICVYK